MKQSSQTDVQKVMMLVGMTMFGGASALLLAMIMQRS
tara:strand:- start:250 stop:360 length:111 start_codon:yes stop_codon:yes gene_type:complete